MKIYNLKSLQSKLTGKFLFLDNTALILFINYIEQFSDFIQKVKDEDCDLLTIPSIVFEFQRTENINAYNQRINFINKYVTVYPIERHLDDNKDLITILNRIKSKISYSDFLLYACMYKFQDSFLLTENHNDFTLDILDREEVITIDTNTTQLRNTALYKFNLEKYKKAAAGILKLDETF